MNAITGREYQGINIFLLWADGKENGYTSNKWATLKQWGGAGYRIKDSEIKRNTPIIFYKLLEKKGQGDEVSHFPMLRASWVFNASQVENYNADTPIKEHTPDAAHIAAQAWFDQMGIELDEGEPAYSPSKDKCYMPKPSAFKTLDHYWSTMFHEAVHWTSHASRLDRKTASFFRDTEGYAFEELVAELGAAFMDARFGIEADEVHDQHGAYLRSWLRHIKADDKRRILMSASKQATAAYNFLVRENAVEMAEVA